MKNKGQKLFGRRVLSSLVVVCVGVLLYMALSNFEAVRSALASFYAIFSPFVIGVAIAYLLNMPVRFFERTLFKRLKRKRAFSILLTYLLALLFVALLISLVLPQLIDSVRTLLNNVGGYLNNLNAFVDSVGTQLGLDTEGIDMFLVSYNDLVNQLASWVRSALPGLLNMGVQIGSGVVGFLTAIIASVYMLFGKEKLLRQCRRVLYALFSKTRADGIMRIGRLSNGVFSGFIGGKIIDSAIIGAICFVFMSIMNIFYSLFGVEAIRMPYAPLISIIIGVTNIIPFFGPFIGAIPSVMILLMVNPWSAFWFTIFIIVLQQFDGNILGPRILGDSTGLPAMWVLVAIIVGGGLFGFMGMLLGVPTTAVLYTLASDFIETRLRKKKLADEPALSAPPPPMAANGRPAGTESEAPGIPFTKGDEADLVGELPRAEDAKADEANAGADKAKVGIAKADKTKADKKEK